MVMPALLIQKPRHKSKAKDHTVLLERCLQQWTNGDLDDLMNKDQTIQHQATQAHRNPRDPRRSAHTFAPKEKATGEKRTSDRAPFHIDY